MKQRTLHDDRGAILRIAGNVAAGMVNDGMLAIPPEGGLPVYRDVARNAVNIAIAIVDEVNARLDATPVAPTVIPPKPPRTAYRDEEGVYHPPPGTANYERHRAVCNKCLLEDMRDSTKGTDPDA